MQQTTKRNLTLALIIVVVVICVGYTAWNVWPRSKKSVVAPHEEPAKPYYLYTESDNGTTTQVIIGGTAIIQLSETSYSEPISIYDADGNAVSPAIEHYTGYIVASFSVPTTTEVTVSAHGLNANQNFSLTLKPVLFH